MINRKTLRNIKLIARREFKARVEKKVFKIVTRFMLLIALLIPSVPVFIQYFTQDNAQTNVVILNQAGTVAGRSPAATLTYLGQLLNSSSQAPAGSGGTNPAYMLNAAATADKAVLEQQVKAGKIDALLLMSRDNAGQLEFDFTTRQPAEHPGVAQFKQVTAELAIQDRLQGAGLSLEQQQKVFNPASFKLNSTASDKEQFIDKNGSQYFTNYTITLLMIMLILVGINLYGNWIAQGIVEEKSSRVMEVMLKATTPGQLMFGKILGVGAAGLTQFAALLAGYIIGTQVQGQVRQTLLGASSASSNIDLLNSVGLLLAALVFFVLGFFLYSTLYAGLAALVSRADEVQQAVAPLYYLVMVVYLASFAALSSPDEIWVKVLSFVPFFSPMFMVLRLGLGNVSMLEVGAAMVLTAGSAILIGLMGAALYRNGILHYGRRQRILGMLKAKI